MSGIVQMAFPLLKPNMHTTFPTAAFYTEMLGVKTTKMDVVKGLFISISDKRLLMSSTVFQRKWEMVMMKTRLMCRLPQ